MKKLLQMALGLTLAASALAKETISIVFPYTPTHGTTPVFYPLVEEANKLQNKYNFVFETKPGGNGLIALNYMNGSPANRVAVIAPAFVENTSDGKILESDFVHVVGMGDMCMAVFNKHGNEAQGFSSLKGTKDLVLGGVGWGNGSHLVGLQIGEKYDLTVRNIVFKSNNEGLVNLAQDGGVTQVFDRINAFNDLKSQAKVQPKILGVSCSQRLKDYPHIKTLKEQGITAPSPWIIITSSKDMPTTTRVEIADIINKSLQVIGQQRVWELSSLQPLIFTGQNLNEYYLQKATLQRALLRKFQSAIDADRGTTAK